MSTPRISILAEATREVFSKRGDATKMAPKLYLDQLSPSCRAIMMICAAHDIPIEYVETSLVKKDHLKEDFLKKNPMHTVPTLEDGDLILHDSHVILSYLMEKNGKSDPWYPKDLKQRARVDQKLYFEALLFNRMKSITYPAIFEGVRVPQEKAIRDLVEMISFLEQFLSSTKYVAGDHMTIADVSIVATLSTISDIIPLDANKYPKTCAWFEDMEKQSFYREQNVLGRETLKTILKDCLDVIS